jgi:hypothetical protein
VQISCWCILYLQMFVALCIEFLQHNTASLAVTYKQTECYTVIAVPPHFIMLAHNLITALNRSMVYGTFFV